MEMNSNAKLGSAITARMLRNVDISTRSTTAPDVRSVTSPEAVSTVNPSTWESRSPRSSATKSTTLRSTASEAVTDAPSLTESSANSTSLPRRSATETAKATASLMILSLAVSPDSRPTGVAAPIEVAGAMAATWAAIVMNVPAEAARAPAGST
jgi:hypothetical protein